MTQEKDINYWKNNCEENYITTPISVLRYISELEKLVILPQQEISDGGKDTADYIDRHIIESMKELAKEGFKPKLSEISDEEIEKASNSHNRIYMEEKAFYEGAKWYREQIKLKNHKKD